MQNDLLLCRKFRAVNIANNLDYALLYESYCPLLSSRADMSADEDAQRVTEGVEFAPVFFPSRTVLSLRMFAQASHYFILVEYHIVVLVEDGREQHGGSPLTYNFPSASYIINYRVSRLPYLKKLPWKQCHAWNNIVGANEDTCSLYSCVKIQGRLSENGLLSGNHG